MGKVYDYSIAEVLKCVKDSGAIISTIADRLGCTWSTAHKYIEKWDETKAAYNDEEQRILDESESTVYNAVKSGDVQAAKWVLSTKGKTRGFTERHEVTGPEGTQLKIEVEYVGKNTAKNT